MIWRVRRLSPTLSREQQTVRKSTGVPSILFYFSFVSLRCWCECVIESVYAATARIPLGNGKEMMKYELDVRFRSAVIHSFGARIHNLCAKLLDLQNVLTAINCALLSGENSFTFSTIWFCLFLDSLCVLNRCAEHE